MGEVQEHEGAEVVAIARANAPGAAVTLFGAADPRGVVQAASEHAAALTDVLRSQRLALRIGDKAYVKVEGWTLLGSMVGVFPVEVSTLAEPEDWRERGLERPEGYVAVVEARTRAGEVVGRANARCMRTEKRWRDADDYAIASMAQTRATSKALRMPLGYIVVLAGYSATPAEEIDGQDPGWNDGETKPKSKPKATPKVDPVKADRTAAWAEAEAAFGDRKTVLDAYREHYGVTGAVKFTDVSAEQLRELVGVLREAGGEVVEGEVVEG